MIETASKTTHMVVFDPRQNRQYCKTLFGSFAFDLLKNNY